MALKPVKGPKSHGIECIIEPYELWTLGSRVLRDDFHWQAPWLNTCLLQCLCSWRSPLGSSLFTLLFFCRKSYLIFQGAAHIHFSCLRETLALTLHTTEFSPWLHTLQFSLFQRDSMVQWTEPVLWSRPHYFPAVQPWRSLHSSTGIPSPALAAAFYFIRWWTIISLLGFYWETVGYFQLFKIVQWTSLYIHLITLAQPFL